LAASNLATANLFFVPLMYLASLFPILAGVFVLREYGAAWRRPPSVRTSS
jgi:hypothetical protein